MPKHLLKVVEEMDWRRSPSAAQLDRSGAFFRALALLAMAAVVLINPGKGLDFPIWMFSPIGAVVIQRYAGSGSPLAILWMFDCYWANGWVTAGLAVIQVVMTGMLGVCSRCD